MLRPFLPAILVALMVGTVGASPGEQVAAGAKAGAAAGGSVGPDGASAYAGLTPGGAWVDPGVRERFEVDWSQVVILVVEAGRHDHVRAALEGLRLVHHSYDELGMFSVLLPRDALEDVEGIPGVLIIYRNERMQPLLDEAAPYTGATVVWKTYNVRGAGVTTMIVDSGIDGTHPDVRLGENLIQNVMPVLTGSGILGTGNVENAPMTDYDGHGTHVASIAGGTARSSADPGKYLGIANAGKLVGFAAGIQDPTSGEVEFESQTVLEAFNYALAKQKSYGIQIVSNSWGAGGEFDPKSPVNIATLQLYKAGMLVTFAAGNEGDGAHTLNKYSVAPWVLGVAAGDYLNKLGRFSSRGTDPAQSKLPYDHPDVVAPGVGITAAKASGGTLTGRDAGDYATKSGTSMATPHVAGIAALLLSANPKLSPDDLMDILTATATPMPDEEVWEAGAGYVNAFKAYQLSQKTTGSRDSFLKGTVKYAGAESGDPRFARDAVTVGFGAGQAQRLSSGSQSLEEFGNEVLGTVHGWVFLAGFLVLVPLAFGLRSRFR